MDAFKGYTSFPNFIHFPKTGSSNFILNKVFIMSEMILKSHFTENHKILVFGLASKANLSMMMFPIQVIFGRLVLLSLCL